MLHRNMAVWHPRLNLGGASRSWGARTMVHAQLAPFGACAAIAGASMECTINWHAGTGMGFVAETGSGHLLTMDGAPDGGGRNLAPRPMETVLAGTGGCTAYDVVLILKRGRHDVTRLPGQGEGRACRRPTRRSSRASTCTSSSAGSACLPPRWRGPSRCRTNVLLGQHHAGQDGADHHRFRTRRSLNRCPSKHFARSRLLAAGKTLEFRGRGARTCMLDVDAFGWLVESVQALNENVLPQHRRP